MKAKGCQTWLDAIALADKEMDEAMKNAATVDDST